MPQKKNPSDLPLLCRTPVPFPTVPAAGRYGSRLTRCGQLPKFGWRIQPSGRFSPLRRSGDILPTSSLNATETQFPGTGLKLICSKVVGPSEDARAEDRRQGGYFTTIAD